MIRELANLPLAEDIPIAFNSCRQGPRGIEWRADRDAEICWMEAQVLLAASPCSTLDKQACTRLYAELQAYCEWQRYCSTCLSSKKPCFQPCGWHGMSK